MNVLADVFGILKRYIKDDDECEKAVMDISMKYTLIDTKDTEGIPNSPESLSILLIQNYRLVKRNTDLSIKLSECLVKSKIDDAKIKSLEDRIDNAS